MRALLPKLGSQASSTNIVFHARLAASEGDWSCYLAEGSDEGGKFTVRGWFLGVVDAWQIIPLEKVLDSMHQQGVTVFVDECFTPTPYADVRSVALPRIA